MTLEQLRIFVAVAERQHMTRGAEAVHLAQSAASAAIAALEQRYGVKLFDRLGRGVALTDAGRAFLIEARGVLDRAEAAEQTLAALSGLKRGALRVHASQTIASYWLPRYIVAYRRSYPDIDIKLAIGNSAQVAAAIQDGSAELGFVEGRVEAPLLSSATVARDQLVIVVAPGHPWADRLPTKRALQEHGWVLREAGSGTRSAFETALAEMGITNLTVALTLPSNEAVRAAVEAGLGATAISASVAAPSIEAGLLRTVKMQLPERDFCLVRHTQRSLSHAAEAFAGLVSRVRAGESGLD